MGDGGRVIFRVITRVGPILKLWEMTALYSGQIKELWVAFAHYENHCSRAHNGLHRAPNPVFQTPIRGIATMLMRLPALAPLDLEPLSVLAQEPGILTGCNELAKGCLVEM